MAACLALHKYRNIIDLFTKIYFEIWYMYRHTGFPHGTVIRTISIYGQEKI